jgi:hypothetical protein
VGILGCDGAVRIVGPRAAQSCRVHRAHDGKEAVQSPRGGTGLARMWDATWRPPTPTQNHACAAPAACETSRCVQPRGQEELHSRRSRRAHAARALRRTRWRQHRSPLTWGALCCVRLPPSRRALVEPFVIVLILVANGESWAGLSGVPFAPPEGLLRRVQSGVS